MRTGAPAAAGTVPHRHPFRFIDRGGPEAAPRVALSAGAVLSRNSTSFPLTLLIEIMAQGALVALDGAGDGAAPHGETSTGTLRMAGIDDARLHGPARPGDVLRVVAEVEGRFAGVTKVACRLEGEDGRTVAEARLLLAAGRG